jgi:hypothetical protein
MRGLRQRETARLADTLSRQLNAIHVPHEPGSRQARRHPERGHLHSGPLEASPRTAAWPRRPGALLAPIASCGPSIAAARCPGEAGQKNHIAKLAEP